MVEEASMSIRCGGDGVDVDGSDLVGRGRCRWIRCGGDGVDVDGDPIGRRRRRGRTVAAAGGVVEAAPWGWMQRGRFHDAEDTGADAWWACERTADAAGADARGGAGGEAACGGGSEGSVRGRRMDP
jgi:hypothetical protein